MRLYVEATLLFFILRFRRVDGIQTEARQVIMQRNAEEHIKQQHRKGRSRRTAVTEPRLQEVSVVKENHPGWGLPTKNEDDESKDSGAQNLLRYYLDAAADHNTMFTSP